MIVKFSWQNSTFLNKNRNDSILLTSFKSKYLSSWIINFDYIQMDTPVIYLREKIW